MSGTAGSRVMLIFYMALLRSTCVSNAADLSGMSTCDLQVVAWYLALSERCGRTNERLSATAGTCMSTVWYHRHKDLGGSAINTTHIKRRTKNSNTVNFSDYNNHESVNFSEDYNGNHDNHKKI